MGDASVLDGAEPKIKVQQYTGKITDNPAPPDDKYEEPIFAKEPPSSEIFGDGSSFPLNSTDNRELQELHRFTNDPIDSQSNSTIQKSVLDRPAAGAGGSSNIPPPVNRGRRHVRTTIFENECNEYGLANGPAAGLGPQSEVPNDQNQEIFSIKGTRSIKINRHRDTVNVFPSGCMGIPQPQDILPKIPEGDAKPQIIEEIPQIEEFVMTSPESTPRKTDDDEIESPRSVTQYNMMQKRKSRPLSAVQRNPLTGVGYEDQDFIRQSTMKKRDGNPVLGQGYETKDLNNKSKKIPPGGYSRGLW